MIIFTVLMFISIFLELIAINFFVKAIKLLKEAKIGIKEETHIAKRVHPTGSQANFSSAFNGRTSVYEKYKNKDGLYEPVKGKHGINLKSITKEGEE